MKNKIILVNMGGYGDILNCTPIAKHHKIVDPNCEIIWLTRKKYYSAIKNNKNIDKIIFAEEGSQDTDNVRLTLQYINLFRENKIEAKFIAPYSQRFLTNKNLIPARSSLLNIIKYETSGIENFVCDFIPNIFLNDSEKKEANDFFSNLKGSKKILFEYENFSNQSPFDEEYFKKLCDYINNKNYDLIFTGASKPKYLTDEIIKHYKINFYHYTGSFMSNAELYNLCDAFISTCSGITCLTYSDYCKTDKLRIEVCHGYHWSSVDWTHMKNKHIVFYMQQFTKALNDIQLL